MAEIVMDYGSAGNSSGDSLGMLGGLMSGATSAFSNVANVVQGIKNYEAQDNENAWRHNLQQRLFDREDDAVRRRIADLRAAGLSPTLAAGSAAQAGPAVSTQAPQLNLGNLGNPVKDSMDSMAKYMALKQSQAQINQTEAQTALLHQQAMQNMQTMPLEVERQELANSLTRGTMGITIDQASEKLLSTRIDNYINDAVKDYVVGRAKVDLDLATQNLVNKTLDNKLKELGITQSQLDIVSKRYSNNVQGRTQLDDINIKALTAGSLAIANDTAKGGRDSAIAKGIMDMQDAKFWQSHGISRAQSENTARFMQLLIGASPRR